MRTFFTLYDEPGGRHDTNGNALLSCQMRVPCSTLASGHTLVPCLLLILAADPEGTLGD